MKSRNQRGMTLIEVMAALAIFALAALSVVNVASEHIRSLSYLEQKTMAQWLANNHLVDVQLDTTFPSLGVKRGEVELSGKKWFWLQQVEKTDDPQFRSVNIRLFAEEESTNALADLTTFVVKK
ncbi:type II secretion system minor pseudopilin GspI [Psychrobium sp. 1_MG-2023]|uniref:type II secretion system minor pseudopilin GspI n=1 Tax=Psychrobium sp. 1_MG-2023 TaxID=3062624 RepID=UPI0026D1CF95|nr:type II secretion system minor pseudopilin GspI [Psychrobium sp. 1_MG-2023]MDP2561936.1 type II secretion system minor pseudopilin GspI [Psychrobium sp. 1_MG-2023]